MAKSQTPTGGKLSVNSDLQEQALLDEAKHSHQGNQSSDEVVEEPQSVDPQPVDKPDLATLIKPDEETPQAV